MKNKKVDTYHWQELIQMTYVMNHTLSTLMLTHPTSESIPEIKERLTQVETLLGEVYQLAGGYQTKLEEEETIKTNE